MSCGAFSLKRSATTASLPWWCRRSTRPSCCGGSWDAAPALIDAAATLPASGVVLVPLKLAKGLEFDHVIVPDASERAFPDDPLSRRRLYTTVSRATRGITLLAQGEVTPLLAGRA